MNRKVGRLIACGQSGVAALGLHLLCNTYARHNGTGGVIEAHVPQLLIGATGRKLADLLAVEGMFDVHPDGWMIHDYAEFHDPNDPDPDRSAADRKRELSDKRREAGRKGGQAKASNAASKPVAELQQTSTPDPVPNTASSTTSHHRSHGVDDDDFAATVTLIVDARCQGRTLRSPEGYRFTVARDVEAKNGAWIREKLASGHSPATVAAFEFQAETDTPHPIAWCGPECSTCGGDAWIDTGSGLAPCPERKNAA